MNTKCEGYDEWMKYDTSGCYRVIGRCMGTKEMEECSCGGDKTKCNFYPDIKEKAKIDNFISELKREEKNKLSQQEIIDVVNEYAAAKNKTVPAEFYVRLLTND